MNLSEKNAARVEAILDSLWAMGIAFVHALKVAIPMFIALHPEIGQGDFSKIGNDQIFAFLGLLYTAFNERTKIPIPKHSMPGPTADFTESQFRTLIAALPANFTDTQLRAAISKLPVPPSRDDEIETK